MKLSFVYSDDLESCKKVLIEHGYKVLDPINYFPVESVSDLVGMFYTILYEVNPEARECYNNPIIDHKLMSEFVKNRMKKENINKQRALQECAEIILYLFKFVRNGKLKLKYPVKSVRILGQGKLKWITEKVEHLMLIDKWCDRNKKREDFDLKLKEVESEEIIEDQFNREEYLERLLKRIVYGKENG